MINENYRILITTSLDPHHKDTQSLCKDLECCIPGSKYVLRTQNPPTDILTVKVVEQMGRPYSIRISDKLSVGTKGEVNYIDLDIIQYKPIEKVNPGKAIAPLTELMASNFENDEYNDVLDWLIKLYGLKLVNGRQVASFTVHRGFIYFRMYRSLFTTNKNADLLNIGPHITFRLREKVKDGVRSKFKYNSKGVCIIK
ncbi:Ribosome production factor 1 [Astathelohania contejeani]|uniref:Ribosome production factor 1 n=1 Tax=Astathelohania contejeani TaxID=164912 RepID=A0ABQ7I065_9MICR|nr:Ribosome production factor 1 [Thelohania contejeani]